ncbi:gtp-binding protein rheb [Anaeramoeba ignava]|uniref:Gtp-binding protein rheb n=1 Tax=Anaeramoeba ignava TaxID=1746090 RepID=A0A9Q0R5X7_ANAIG|nr:gtp-binding protein rheb [Anaeramoeba ignava]
MKTQKQRRVVILGFRGVGKTAITTRFINNSFNSEHTPTIENSFKKTIKFCDEEYEIDILDTPGQDEFTRFPTNDSVITDAYILVYSVSSVNSFEILKVIHDKINEKIGTIPQVLVGNKNDLEKREVKFEEGKKLAKEWSCSFIECTAKENENIAQVFLSTLEEIEKSTNPNFGKKKDSNCLII